MAHLLTFFNLLFTAVAPRTTTHVRLPHARKRKREGWYWQIVISLVYFALLISLTNLD